jgi:hypothetical protein
LGSGASCDGEDCQLSVSMIAEETGFDKNSVHRILTNHLHKRKICAKLVSKHLSVKQKVNRLEICQDLPKNPETEPNLLDKVTTGDESCVFKYVQRQNCQSEE